ncbi:endonuclease III domain-containing protein [Oceanidesulfovibrio marinus]|uniref:Endonuclease III domain-containing protein n=2 Tax=Oceanidesulfovibrio marinus TaxID=370038 RepID=A0ABX6NFH8_9BACT|nr:endonuclease III domain-containing protein [Oceanidesulfovibrio marinus]
MVTRTRTHSSDGLAAWHDAMADALGPMRWWPADTPFEVAVGAILTQNTNWTNVKRAIDNLKDAEALDAAALHAMDAERLAELIRPAGYFRLKAGRLKNLVAFIAEECDMDVLALADMGLDEAREKLLTVRGVGPETADSILCYAAGMPTFVVDAYTARIANRHGLLPEDVSYDELREYFMDRLAPDPELYNEFHAQLVHVGNGWCKKKAPRCGEGCPLEPFLP